MAEELVSLRASDWRTRASGSHGSSLTTRLWWLCSGCSCCCCHCRCLAVDTFFSPLFSLLRLKLSSFCLLGSPPDGLNFLGFFGSLWNWLFSLCLFFKLWSPAFWFLFIPPQRKTPNVHLSSQTDYSMEDFCIGKKIFVSNPVDHKGSPGAKEIFWAQGNF